MRGLSPTIGNTLCSEWHLLKIQSASASRSTLTIVSSRYKQRIANLLVVFSGSNASAGRDLKNAAMVSRLMTNHQPDIYRD
jgi:hypothetical protein